MRWRKSYIIILAFVILVSVPTLGRAVGIDIMPIVVKLTEQLSEMTKQLTEFKKISAAAQDQIDAIGKFGQITLPLINAVKMGAQIRQDMQCLKPDFSKLMPNIEFEDLDWNSVCEGKTIYEKTLWVDPDQLVEKPTWQERDDAVQDVKKRRERVLEDAASKGLALADTSNKDVESTNRAADEIDAAANSASDQRAQIAVLLKAQAMLLRGQAKEQQIQAQQLKVISALAIHLGLPPEKLPVEGDKQ